MMTKTYKTSPTLVLLLIVGAMILMAMVRPVTDALTEIASDFATSHGLERHGVSAVRVRSCLDQRGAMQEWVNPQTGRHAFLCELEPGLFGIQIAENSNGIWKEITSFVKNKLHKIEQVARYLENSGYQRIH